LEEPSFEEEEYVDDDDDYYQEELVYHNELVDERFVQAHQQMYSTDDGNNKTHKRSDTKDSNSSWVRINEFDKRKKTVLDKLGIQL
jgi:hypothetical protein